jgi:hypothetical protein
MVSRPFLRKVKIDQGLGRWERCHNAKARPPQRRHYYKEPASICAANARGTFFAVHSLSLDVERIVFNDLLGLPWRNLMASNVSEVGIIPFEGKVEIQLIL